MLANHTFLIVVILGVIAMVNNGEPISELTFYLIAFILPGTMLMSLYMMRDNPVLNSTDDSNNHGSKRIDEDSNS